MALRDLLLKTMAPPRGRGREDDGGRLAAEGRVEYGPK
jgi:hypothetical protein